MLAINRRTDKSTMTYLCSRIPPNKKELQLYATWVNLKCVLFCFDLKEARYNGNENDSTYMKSIHTFFKHTLRH